MATEHLERISAPERDPVEDMIKRNIAQVLGSLEAEVDFDEFSSGSDYLTLRMMATDEETGLSRGVLVHTDKRFEEISDDPAYRGPGELGYAYCTKSMCCVFVEELPADHGHLNINVRELEWNSGQGFSLSRCRLVEEGFAGISVRSALFGNRGLYQRLSAARQFGVNAEDFLLSDESPSPEVIEEFFTQIDPDVLSSMKILDLR